MSADATCAGCGAHLSPDEVGRRMARCGTCRRRTRAAHRDPGLGPQAARALMQMRAAARAAGQEVEGTDVWTTCAQCGTVAWCGLWRHAPICRACLCADDPECAPTLQIRRSLGLLDRAGATGGGRTIW